MLIQHVRRKTKGIGRILFVIDKALAFKDSLSGDFLLFLVPRDGSEGIIGLHDILYTDFLAAELRSDIPFVPHITIGNGRDPAQLSKLAARLNRGKLNIKGSIDVLEIALLGKSSVKTLEHITLA
jgi:2'-5' RNA ligase